jgi:hypothetical protein
VVLYVHHQTRDLRERKWREIPIPVFDELEPEAMEMGGGENVGVWWRRCFP